MLRHKERIEPEALWKLAKVPRNVGLGSIPKFSEVQSKLAL